MVSRITAGSPAWMELCWYFIINEHRLIPLRQHGVTGGGLPYFLTEKLGKIQAVTVCFQDPGFQAGKDRPRQLGNSAVSPQRPSCLPGRNFQVAAQGARAPVGPRRQRCLNLQGKDPERTANTGDGRGPLSWTAEGWSAPLCEESTSSQKGTSWNGWRHQCPPRAGNRACSRWPDWKPPTSWSTELIITRSCSVTGVGWGGGWLATELLGSGPSNIAQTKNQKGQTVCK